MAHGEVYATFGVDLIGQTYELDLRDAASDARRGRDGGYETARA